MKHLLVTVITIIFMTKISKAQTFSLYSKDLGGQITTKQLGNGMGCTGDNISPELHWENAPKETKAFAISIYDMDAPTGSGFWHWSVFNIPSDVTALKSDAGNFSGRNLPQGAVHGNNDAGAPGYVGPCPPAGETHRYIITVTALAAPVAVDKNASPALTNMILNMNALAKASLLVYGKR